MKVVSDAFKIKTKKIKQQDIKLTVIEEDVVQEIRIVPDITYYNMPISILKESNKVIAKELKYSFDGKLFKTIMKQIDITVKNANEIKDKNINFQYGLYINNKYEYVDLGDFYIKDVEDDKKKEELVVTGYDKMLNFMKPFKQSDLKLIFPCTVKQLASKMGEICEVELYSTDFYNSDLIIDEDFFTAQELTYRDVLEKITQATFTTAFIKENKLYFCKVGNKIVQKLDKSYLSNLIIGEKFGPINAFVIGRGDVEDNVEAKDDINISQNGRCEIRFDENELIEYKREQIINDMFQEIRGLEYYSFEASDVGVMWLEPCDLLEVSDREDNFYKTIYLKAEITINTGIKGNMEADIIEETNTKYKVTTKEEKKTLKVERLAKKNEGLIQDLVEETTEHEQKLTQVEQDVDSIKQSVNNTINYKRTAEGITEVHLYEAGQNEILKLEVKGNKEYISELFPRTNLYPRANLHPNQKGG